MNTLKFISLTALTVVSPLIIRPAAAADVVINANGTSVPNPVHVSKSHQDTITWKPNAHGEVSFDAQSSSPFAPPGNEDDYFLVKGYPKTTPVVRPDCKVGQYPYEIIADDGTPNGAQGAGIVIVDP